MDTETDTTERADIGAGDVWDPRQYGRFAAPRTRPFRDLLARVPELAAEHPRVADLGCGSGEPTALLAARWPAARVTGYDTSDAMLSQAARHAGPLPGGGALDFRAADIAAWRPDGPLDLIISNAALQWTPGVEARFGEWIAALRPGGVLAFQVPGNFGSPAHQALRDLCHHERWSGRLAGSLPEATPVLQPDQYAALLAGAGCEVDVWETTYLHVLAGPDPVLEWMKGTALRPVLTALREDPVATDDFLTEYRNLLRAAYPPEPHGTVFPFRRIFAVARRPADPDRPATAPSAGTEAGARAGTEAGTPPGTEANARPHTGITELDHVQLPAPPGSEPELRAFYGGVLGMTETAKPPALAARGGCWFETGTCRLHLGIDADHRPSGTSHPGIRVTGLRDFVARLEEAGVRAVWDDRLPGHGRAYVHDPVGNRLEFLERWPERD